MAEWNALTSEMPQASASIGMPMLVLGAFAIAVVVIVGGLLLWVTQKW